ncbi:MAG: hypothetical protein AAFW73_00105 [Bacteroidota bacterium]
MKITKLRLSPALSTQQIISPKTAQHIKGGNANGAAAEADPIIIDVIDGN